MTNNLKINIACLILIVISTLTVLITMMVFVNNTWRTPVVKTKFGVIKGVRAKVGGYSMYLGIPYAKVNDSNPFGIAVPYTDFVDVFHAYNESTVCPQKEEHNDTIVGTLDCLRLHINVPNSASRTNKLPVLVYINGGEEVGFTGRYSYGAKFLMKHNIILVTFNYRVGPYGFLCLDIPAVAGNQGLKDQILALKWIKENIEAFGGDSNKITLAGESTGGTYVDLHLTFGEKELFNNAIIGSGIMNDALTLKPADNTVLLKLAVDIGLATNDTVEALTFLSKLDSNIVMASSVKHNISYGPCIEKEFGSNIPRLITSKTKNEEIPNVKNVNILMSQSNTEMLYALANEDLDTGEHEDIFKNTLETIFDMKNDSLKSLVKETREFYIDNRNVTNAVKQPIIDFLSDIIINYPIREKIKYYIKQGANNIYYSIFSYTGKRNFMNELKGINRDIKTASHVDEIGYLFDISDMTDVITPNDQIMIDRITTLWANFVKYGNPTPERTALLPIIWEPVTKRSLLYLNIDSDLSIGIKPFEDRMLFWEKIYRRNDTFPRLSTVLTT